MLPVGGSQDRLKGSQVLSRMHCVPPSMESDGGPGMLSSVEETK